MNLPELPRWVTHVAAALLAAVLAVGVTIVVTPSPSPTPGHKPLHTVTVHLGGPGHAPVALDAQAQTALAAAKTNPPAETDVHETATPAPAALNAANRLAPASQPAIPARPPQAAPSVKGCTTALVRNYSSRNGAKVVLGVIHWTGSWAPGPSIVRWFDTPAAEASSNEITDQAGHCWLAVPEYEKAWTQAAANPWAVSVEIVNPGVLPLFRTTAARRAVLRLIVGWHHRWGIPYQRGAVNGSCVPTRPGFLAHRDLGICGGGHPDVGATDLGALIRDAHALDRPHVSPTVAAAKVACRKLTWHRARARAAHAAGRHYWTVRGHLTRAHALKAVIARGGIACPAR